MNLFISTLANSVDIFWVIGQQHEIHKEFKAALIETDSLTNATVSGPKYSPMTLELS